MSLIELVGIQKSYYNVKVLHSVNFTLQPGTVHALMGENGAGKSTLMKIVAGVHSQDAGEIRLDGHTVTIPSPAVAQGLGIAMIHQELNPVMEMSVAENIYLGREPVRFGLVDYKELYRQTEELLSQLDIPISPRKKMKELRLADQQMVEIAKAVSQNARVIIMDEPTSAITDKEVDNLFRIIDTMRERGAGIIYISHKMAEIFRIADEISVLRDGCNISTWKRGEVDIDTLTRSMVGREISDQYPKKEPAQKDVILEVRNLTLSGQYENISFQLHRGEILGFVGLVGSGRTELMHSIFGLTRPEAGEIFLEGKKVSFRSPRQAITSGLAYVTEDRKREGLVLSMSVEHNASLAHLRHFTTRGLLRRGHEWDAVGTQVNALRIKVKSPRQLVKSLSGGNQQKVVLAKWMMKNPKVIIFDEPTRGIDVGAKAEIYKIMCDYAAQGNAVIMVSSEMPEAMGMSDRIIVLSNHKYADEIRRADFDQEAIVQMQFSHI